MNFNNNKLTAFASFTSTGGGEGGGVPAMIVTVSGQQADCTATDIFNHVAAGGVALLNHYGTYHMLAHCSAETAYFVYTAEDAVDTVFIIDAQGAVDENAISYATAGELNDIDAALDTIIAIQNALIGGETA